MTDPHRDARALVDRVRKRDGPSDADRQRLRARLDVVWAEQRAAQASAQLVVQPLMAARPRGYLMSLVLVASSVWLARDSDASVRHAYQQVQLTAAQPTAPVAPPSERLPNAVLPVPEAVEVAALPRAVSVPVRGASAKRRDTAAHGGAARARPPKAGPLAMGSSVVESEARVEPTPARAVDMAASERAAAADRQRDVAPDELAVRAARATERSPQLRDRELAPQALDDELSWLGAAQQALSAGEPSRALRLVQQHAFRFPRGALATERKVVQALALCALQRKAAARVVVDELVRAAPSSPLVLRVQRKCELR
jgi:hypothetical protein